MEDLRRSAATSLAVILLVQVGAMAAQVRKEHREFQQDQIVGLHPYYEKGRWGYIDNRGRTVLKAQFAWASDFSEDLAAVSSPERSGYIRLDGSWGVVLPNGAFPARRFTEARAWFRQNDLFGCIDSKANMVIAPKYEWAEEFSEGLAVVCAGRRMKVARNKDVGERYGFVDRSGRVAMPLRYEYAGRFGDGLSLTVRPGVGHHEYVDRTGKVVFSIEGLHQDPRYFVSSASDFSDGRSAVFFGGRDQVQGFATFLATTGHRIGSQKYEGAWPFSEGLARVTLRGRRGYVNTEGQLVIPAKFQDGADFHEGLCRVLVGSAWKYIDRQGTIVASGEPANSGVWNDAEDFRGGLARVHSGGSFVETRDGPGWWQGGKWYYVDRRGGIVFICRLDEERLIEPPLGREHQATMP